MSTRPRAAVAASLKLGALLLSSLVLAGCGGRHEPHDGRVHVTLWSGWTGPEGNNFARMVAEFNRTHPGVVIDNLGGVQDDTRTIRAITAGVPPDVFFLWDPGNLGPLIANGAVRSLDDDFKRSGLKDDQFLPAALQLGRMNGKLYSLPFLVDSSGLYWNKTLFRHAHLDPDQPPQTLEELTKDAELLTERDSSGNLKRLGIDLPDIQLVLVLFGGRLLDAGGRPTADDPRNIAAFRWYKDLADRMGGVNQIDSFSSGFGQGQGPNHPFFVGKTAMMLSGEWIPWWIEKYRPDLDYGLAPSPYPAAYPGEKGSSQVGGNPLCIPSESRHPKEAWEFIRWCQEPHAQEEFASLMSNVPNIRAVLHSPLLTRGSRKKVNFGKFLEFANAPNARAIPPSPVMNYYLSEITHARDFMLHGDKTPEQSLHDVQQKVVAELRQENAL